ncbi:hypothetical protein MUGA111182_15060 [Mucilaginibacter galii]
MVLWVRYLLYNGIRVDDSKDDWWRNFNFTSCNVSSPGNNAFET